MQQKALDLTKPVQTRDGRAVRIYATDGGGMYLIHGAIQGKEGGWAHFAWMSAGQADPYHHKGSCDLVNLPAKIRVHRWLNIDEDGSVIGYDTRSEADARAYDDRLACYEIDIEIDEGHGL